MNKIKHVNVENDEIVKLIKIIAVVFIMFFIFFVITLFVSKDKELKLNYGNEVNEIQFEEILASKILKQKEDDYYVLITKKDDEYYELYKTGLSRYNENNLKYYEVVMDNIFNKGHIAEKSNFSVSDGKNIKIKDSTLLKIKSGEIVDVHEGKNLILAYLKEKIK